MPFTEEETAIRRARTVIGTEEPRSLLDVVKEGNLGVLLETFEAIKNALN